MFNEYPKNCIIQNRIIYNTESKSKFKDRFGIKYKEKFWKNLNGERREADGTIVRYVNGYIDGNIYDKQGNIIQSYPAIEFSSNENNGYEYWTRGYPDGGPAIFHNKKLYQEYWICGQLIGIFDYQEDKLILQEGYRKEKYRLEIPDLRIAFGILNEPNLQELEAEKQLQILLETITTVEKALSYDNDITFPQLLEILKHLKNRKYDSDVYERVHLDKRIYSDIKRNKKPVSFDNGILLAMSFELSFDEMIKFINLAGQGFKRGKREKIIKNYFEQRNYSIFELNTELYKNTLELITDKEKKSICHQI